MRNDACFVFLVNLLWGGICNTLADELIHVHLSTHGHADVALAVKRLQDVDDLLRDLSLNHAGDFLCQVTGADRVRVFRKFQAVLVDNRDVLRFHVRDAARHQKLHARSHLARQGCPVLHHDHDRRAVTFPACRVVQHVTALLRQGNGDFRVLHPVEKTDGRPDTVLQVVYLVSLLLHVGRHATRVGRKHVVRKAVLGVSLLRELRPDGIHLVFLHLNLPRPVRGVWYLHLAEFSDNLRHLLGSEIRVERLVFLVV